MKKIIVFFALILITSQAYAAVAFVKSTKKYAGSGTSTTLAITATSGNFLFATIGTGNSSITTSITDNAGGGSNTYTYIQRANASTFSNTDTFYAKNIVGGSLTLTFNSDTSNNFAIIVSEFSGVDTTSPLIGTAVGSNTSSGASVDITSASLSAGASSGDLIVAAGGNYYTPLTWVIGSTNPSGMTVESTSDNQIGNGVGNDIIEYAVLSGSYSGALSINPGTSTYGCINAAAFKTASSAPATNTVTIKNATINGATLL